jgi:RNA recognition motif-containing protein
MVNIPHNCTELELTTWVESHGVGVKSVRLIQDTVACVSPSFAYVEVSEEASLDKAIRKLNGLNLRERVIIVSEARSQAAGGPAGSPRSAA